jgi:hypothetical protein
MIAALATDVTVRGLIIQQAWLNGGDEAWPQVLARPWRPDEGSRVEAAG